MKLMAYDGTFLYFGGHDWGIKGSLLLLSIYIILLIIVQRNRFFHAWARWKERLRERSREKGSITAGKETNEFTETRATDRSRKRRTRAVLCFLALLVFPLYWAYPAQDSDSLAATVFGSVLRWETPLAGILITIVACEMIAIRGDKTRFLETVNRIVRPMLLVCLYATAASRQVLLLEHGNALCFCALCAIFVILGEFDFETQGEEKHPTGRYAAVEDYNALFTERKREADQLIELIRAAPDDAYSICVNGPWGSGKTSVVNGALNKLKSDAPEDYEEIRINALEMDTVQSLLSYVFDQIKQCLKRRGAYVGWGSEYRNVVSGLMKTAGMASTTAWLEKTVFPTTEDYRTQRKRLEDIISSTMGAKGKIIITVDDIERCEEDKAKQFIYFTKRSSGDVVLRGRVYCRLQLFGAVL